MYEGGHLQSVLRCGQCNKPFDKQSTLKRHGYYCRSRRVGKATRSRACVSCARGKARCDNKRPGCSRCITKAIECHYPATTPKATEPRNQHNNSVPTEQQKIVPSSIANSTRVENHQEASNNDGDILLLDNALAISDPEFANLGGDYLDWEIPDIDFGDFLSPQTNDETIQYPSSSGSSPLVRHSTPSTDQTVRGVQQQAMSSPNISNVSISIPRLPTYTRRSLIQRPKMQTGTQRTANLIFYTLKSYPLMMLRHNTLPPFIHPHLISSDVESNHMEPLANCLSLVHMISSGVQGSRKLFWKNVQLECERLREEHLKLNKWGLLAAMQALSIYILTRLHEGETDHNNFDVLLLSTVAVIATDLTHLDITCNIQTPSNDSNLEVSWRDWIFEESRRRLSVVYRVVNMLIYFEPADMCKLQNDLILAPLPARKQLWEASDEFAWKTESERAGGSGVQTAFALAANGELVLLDEGQHFCGGHGDAVLLYKPLDATRTPSRSIGSWEEWCSGMDSFGGLVMLAASLVV